MVFYVDIKGFEKFSNYTKKIDSNGPPVLFIFSGSKLSDGSSWCPDCNDAEPVVKSFLDEVKKNLIFVHVDVGDQEYLFVLAEPILKSFLDEVNKNLIFVYVDVGDQEYWRERACPFRTDPRTKLMVIPTIIKWNGVQRLEGSQCCNRELLQMLIEEEE